MRTMALFITECGCEQIVEIPENAPMRYRLPRFRAQSMFDRSSRYCATPVPYREFVRERMNEDGTAIYRETEAELRQWVDANL